MSDSGHLRVGHAERAAAIETLHRAAELGKLTPEELQARIASAEHAVTRDDLDALLADLGLPPSSMSAVTPAPPMFQPGTGVRAPGSSPSDPLEINATLGDRKRRGPWVIPRYVSVSAVAATVKLDCLQATTAEPVVELQVTGGLGTVVLVVPDGWGVNVDRLSVGEVKTSVPPIASWGMPQFIVSGGMGLGTFKARLANWVERRRLEGR